MKVNGKLIRRSLKANTFEEAKLALHDFIQKESKRRHVVGAPVTFGEARVVHEASLDNDATLSEQSRHYRKGGCIKRLLRSWPGLHNMTLRSFKAILKKGGIAHDVSPRSRYCRSCARHFYRGYYCTHRAEIAARREMRRQAADSGPVLSAHEEATQL